jgi:hypothetical protein
MAVGALVLVAAVVIGVVLRDDSKESAGGDASTPDTEVPLETDPVVESSPPTSIPASTSTSASSPTSTSTSSPAPTSTTSVVDATPVTVDLEADAPQLEPTQILSYPIAPPGDLFPTAYATTAPGDRIVVLDDVTGVVRFVDGTTLAELAQFPTDIPTIGSPSFVFRGEILVGPDDVLYVDEGSGEPGTWIVAYVLRGDRYVEVARVEHPSDGSRVRMFRSGVGFAPESLLMPYLGLDGEPSGATVDIDDVVVLHDRTDVYTVTRAGATWRVQYLYPPDSGLPDTDICILCASASLGPGESVVVLNQSPTPDGDLQRKVTVLSDTVVTYNSDWDYVGPLGGKLLFARLDQDSIDIGTVEI